jgi:YtkA-like protein
MKPWHFRPVVVGFFLLGVVAGCSSDNENQPTDPPPPGGCAQDARVTPFATGMSAKSTSGKLSAEIMNASPSPPQRGAGDGGFNKWTLKLTADGKAPPAADVKVTTLMPDHGHGSPRVPTVAANPDGTFAIGDLYFFMAGVWEVTFSLDQENAKFTICVQ